MSSAHYSRNSKDGLDRTIARLARDYDLYTLVHTLEEPIRPETHPLSEQDVGLFYSALVLGFPRLSYPSSVIPSDGPIRKIKKRFQDKTRVGLYTLILDQEVKEVPFEQRRKGLEQQAMHTARDSPFSFVKGTIESYIQDAILNRVPYNVICSIVKVGAKKYSEERDETERDVRFKEYNLISRAFKEVLS